MVLVWALLPLHCYVGGSRITVHTNHSALRSILNLTHVSGSLLDGDYNSLSTNLIWSILR